MTILMIIDTAIKIGLGAIIAGIVSYLITRLNHKHEIEKERMKRHIELIERIDSTIENFHSPFIDYINHCPVNGDINSVENPVMRERIKINQKLPPITKEELNQKRLLSKHKAEEELAIVQSLIRLLGDKKVDEAFAPYRNTAEWFWIETADNEKSIEVGLWAKRRDELSKTKCQLYEALSRLYPIKIK